MTALKILETDRLLLRHLEPGDLAALQALYADPEIRRYIPDAPTNLAETKEELDWFQRGHPQHPELGLWATIYKPTGQFVGRCGLLPWMIDGEVEVEVAYAIARSHQGRGLATEAAQAILTYGFERLGLTRLICLIDENNVPSIRVAEKIGMTFARESRDEFGPFWIYAISRPH